MKHHWLKALLALAFSIQAAAASATECVDRYIITPHVKLYLCQNGSGYEETTYLLIKARTEALDALIDSRIAAGTMEPRVYHLSLYDPVMSFPQLSITRSRQDVYAEVAEFLSLERMISIVDYSASKDFRPVVTPSFPNASHEQGSAACEAFFRQHHAAASRADTAKTLWQKCGLALVYRHDSLRYYAGSKPLQASHSPQLPFRLGRRCLIFTADKIVVVEAGRIILSKKSKLPYGDYYTLKNSGNSYLFYMGDTPAWQYDYRRNSLAEVHHP